MANLPPVDNSTTALNSGPRRGLRMVFALALLVSIMTPNVVSESHDLLPGHQQATVKTSTADHRVPVLAQKQAQPPMVRHFHSCEVKAAKLFAFMVLYRLACCVILTYSGRKTKMSAVTFVLAVGGLVFVLGILLGSPLLIALGGYVTIFGHVYHHTDEFAHLDVGPKAKADESLKSTTPVKEHELSQSVPEAVNQLAVPFVSTASEQAVNLGKTT
jgi:hypothetical protein